MSESRTQLELKNKTVDDVTMVDLLRLEFPDASDDELGELTQLIDIYRRLPVDLQPKMHKFVSRIADDDEQTYELGQRVIDGDMTLEQMLKEL